MEAEKLTPGIKLEPLANDSPELTELLQRNAIEAMNEFKSHLEARGIRFIFPAQFLSTLYRIRDDEATGFRFEANSNDYDLMIESQKMREQNTEPHPSEPIVVRRASNHEKCINIRAKNPTKNISGLFH